ncbi:PAS domain S-box-containing protein [Pedobacter africanus]|uniref:PAS domain S-box-containing protein n=1 Tax=Pedobacter africanus TaxID=151894 RepID=A0ACC6KS55_9SPHI|nr:ATP-binding protein [Pedobacter africanus]MDR6781953.1 PAS domain S-box-containing protein [Pedobacter africanus]
MMKELKQRQENPVVCEEKIQALEARVEELTDFIENASIPLHRVDKNGYITWANQAELDTLGFTKEEYIGTHITSFHADQHVIDDILARLSKNETLHNYPARLKCKDGSIKHVLISSNVLRKDGEFLHTRCFTRDVTELVMEMNRKERLLQELEESEARMKMAISSTNMGTWEYTPAESHLYLSPEAISILGFSNEQAIDYAGFLKILHPEERTRIHQELNASVKAISNEIYSTKFKIIRPGDQAERWLHLQGKITLKSAGGSTRFIGTVLDITEAVLAEEKKKQEEQRKNAFIAMVSHEIKTPITAVTAYLQMVLQKAQKDQDSFYINLLSRADVKIKKMTAMVQDFLNVTRLEEGKLQIIKKQFELSKMIHEVAEEGQFLTTTHTINILGCYDLKVFGDEEKLSHVLSNLLSNAIKYSPNGGNVFIKCESLNNKARISVTDQGIGIKESDQKRIFERFYRVNNNQAASGFGIGLYLASEILAHHNSQLQINSKEGVGSTFFFDLEIS